MFLATLVYGRIVDYLGLSPEIIVERFWVWQLATYLFLHGGLHPHPVQHAGHLDVRRGAGAAVGDPAVPEGTTPSPGIGAGLTVLAVGLLLGAELGHVPGDHDRRIGRAVRPAGRVRVLLSGSSAADVLPVPDSREVFRDDRRRDGVSVHAATRACRRPRISAGWSIGYLYLRAGRGGLTAELKYRYLKWRMNRLRRKFDVYSGGRSDWDRHVH